MYYVFLKIRMEDVLTQLERERFFVNPVHEGGELVTADAVSAFLTFERVPYLGNNGNCEVRRVLAFKVNLGMLLALTGVH